MKSLLGATFLWTDLVYMWPRMSFISLEHDASRGIVIETTGSSGREPGQVVNFDWLHDEWKDYGWEILYPENSLDEL